MARESIKTVVIHMGCSLPVCVPELAIEALAIMPMSFVTIREFFACLEWHEGINLRRPARASHAESVANFGRVGRTKRIWRSTHIFAIVGFDLHSWENEGDGFLRGKAV